MWICDFVAGKGKYFNIYRTTSLHRRILTREGQSSVQAEIPNKKHSIRRHTDLESESESDLESDSESDWDAETLQDKASNKLLSYNNI